jgi:hypothetical protein
VRITAFVKDEHYEKFEFKPRQYDVIRVKDFVMFSNKMILKSPIQKVAFDLSSPS